MTLPADLQRIVDFHGHLCPGLVLGYRAAREAMSRLGIERSQDEELVALVENDACGVDAVQFLTGCTFGKGNLIFLDYGKHVYTFTARSSRRALRVSARPWAGEPSREERLQQLLTCRAEELYDFQWVEMEPPEPARIHESVPCGTCGEPVMITRIRQVGEKQLCIPCAEAARRA